MIAMMTKPKSKGKRNWEGTPTPSKMKAVAKAVKTPLYEGDLCAFSIVKTMPLCMIPQPAYKDIEPENLIEITGKVFDFPTPQVSDKPKAREDGIVDDNSAYQSWLLAYTHFCHDPSLTRTERKQVTRKDGTIGVHRTVINKVFATFLLGGDSWGSHNPDGTERYDADYPTRSEAIRRSGSAAFHRRKHSVTLSEVLPDEWKGGRPLLENVWFQYWDSIEKGANTKVDAKTHNRKTIAVHKRDASWWGPTAITSNPPIKTHLVDSGETSKGYVDQDNPMARQYRLKADNCILDEHVRQFEALNDPLFQEDDYANIDRIDSGELKQVYDLLNSSCNGWIAYSQNKLLLPAPSTTILSKLDKELAGINQIALNRWLERHSRKTPLIERSFLKQTKQFVAARNIYWNERVSQMLDVQRDDEQLYKQGDKLLAVIPNAVYRNFILSREVLSEEDRWERWWKAIFLTEGLNTSHQGVAKQPFNYVQVHTKALTGAFTYWLNRVKEGRATIESLRNVRENIKKHRKGKVIGIPVAKIEPVVLDLSPQELVEVVNEDLDKKKSPVIQHLISDPRFLERSNLNSMLHTYQNENRSLVEMGLIDGYMDVNKLAEGFKLDVYTRLLLPEHLLFMTPEQWAREVGVGQPRKTILDKIKDVLHIGTEK